MTESGQTAFIVRKQRVMDAQQLLLRLLKIPFIFLLGNWLHANIVYWSYSPHCPLTTPRHLQYVLLKTSCSLPPPPPSPSLSLSPVGAACYNADCSWLGPGSQSYREFVSIMATLCLENSVLWHCSLSGESYIFFCLLFCDVSQTLGVTSSFLWS